VGGLPAPWDEHPEQIASLLNFDPNVPSERNGCVVTLQTALWDSEGDRPFYIYKGLNHTGSSLLKQNFQYVDENWDELRRRGPSHLADTWHDRSALVRSETVHCRTMDSVLQQDAPDRRFHFLKIDAQGGEAPILRGAERFLETHCVGLQLELMRIPMYEGVVLREEVIAWLADRGFEVVREFPAHGTFDSQNDVVFLHAERGKDEVGQAIRAVYDVHERR
jgi:FkbM family methyltransferase